MEIRSKATAYATMKKKTIRVLEEELESKIRLIEKKVQRTELDPDNLKAAKEKLVDSRQKKIGVQLRLRARWVGKGEKMAFFFFFFFFFFFCGLEKRNFISKQRNNIVAKNGIILTQMNAIIE